MSGYSSSMPFDLAPSDIVPVIASFDKQGKIKPLYVRLGSESYKINDSFCQNEYINTIYFRCHIIDNGYLKPLVLIYYRSCNMWSINY